MILIEREEYDAAAQLLERANRAQAAVHSQQALELGRAAGAARVSRDNPTRRDALRAEVGALRVAGLVAEREGHTPAADTMFNEALALIYEQGPDDLLGEVEMTYADVLRDRGAHAESAAHYRAALQARQRQRRW